MGAQVCAFRRLQKRRLTAVTLSVLFTMESFVVANACLKTLNLKNQASPLISLHPAAVV